MQKVLIVIGGGNVNQVGFTSSDIQLIVIDHDNESTERTIGYDDIDLYTDEELEKIIATDGYELQVKSETETQLFQMVFDLKHCIHRLTQDGLSQSERDKEAQWEGEANDLLLRINPNFYKNANEKE